MPSLMISSNRIGALDIASAISERIGSYVDMNFIEFLAVEGDRIQCWYLNAGGDGPTFGIEMTRSGENWTLQLTEHASGTEQEVEVP
jgi:hypothetical protein